MPVQISSAVQNPSLTTVSLTLSLVTATGVSRIDGTSFVPLSILVVGHAGGVFALGQRHGELAPPPRPPA